MQKKLRDVRLSKGLSQAKFSELSAMEQTTYSRKERGKSPITAEEWERFSNILDVSVNDIKSVDSEKETSPEFQQGHSSSGGIQDVLVRYINKLETENLIYKRENHVLKVLVDKLSDKS